MKTIRMIATLIISVALSVTVATPAHAAPGAEKADAMETVHKVTGVIMQIDPQSNRMLIAHDPVATLDWPAMTMWFTLRTSLPRELKVKDRVHFEIEQAQNRKWEILRIERS